LFIGEEGIAIHRGRLRNRYHSLEDTIEIQALSD
jgi:hypothetical protein